MSIILKEEPGNSIPTPSSGKTALFVDDNGVMSIKNDAGNISTFPTIATSNTQVLFTDGTAIGGDNDFAWDKNNNVLTIVGNVAATRIKTDNLLYANGVPWDLQQAGGSNTQIQFNDGDQFGGSAAFTFDKTSNLVSVSANLSANNVNVTTHVTAGNVWANSGAISAQNLKGEGGNISNIQGANVSGAVGLATYASTANAVAGANVSGEVAYAATANSVAGANVSGQVGNALVAGTVYSASQPNITSVGALSSLSVTGNANVGNLGTAQLLASANITTPQFISNVSTGTAPLVVSSTTKVANLNAELLDGYDTATANTPSTIAVRNSDGNLSANYFIGNGAYLTGIDAAGIQNGTSNIRILQDSNITFSAAGNANIATVTGTGVNVAGTLNVTGNANVGNIGTTAMIATGNANVGNLGTTGSISASGNIDGGNINATSKVVASTLESNVATGTAPFTVASITKVTNLNADLLDGYSTDTANNASTVVVRDVNGNISANYFIGNGSQLTGIDASAIQNGTANVRTFLNGNVAISAAGNANVVLVTGSGANITGTANVSGNANVGNLGTAQVLASANVTAPQLISNVSTGTAPLVVNSTTVVANLRAATSNVANTVNDAAQPNITSVGTLTSLSVTGNANVGNIGATAGVFTGNVSALNANLGNLATANYMNIANDLNVVGNANIGSGTGGNISGANVITANTFVGNLQGNVTLGALANGNSNVNIPAANGNVNISATGTANVLVVTSTGVNVAGTLNATGNANVGNLGAAQVLASANVTAPQLISNVSTGTAPLVVTSTTVVANLRAATSNVANTVNDAAQPNITSVGTLTSLSVTGNVTAGNVAGGNLVSANYVSGTLTTAAQPNITSVGILSSLSVTGNITSGNVYANSGTIGANALVGNTVAGNLTTAAQPNVTSLGVLTGLNVNGDITAANITANTGVFTGNGSGLSQLAGGNVTGQVANALVAGTVYTNAQPNITSVGTLSSLTVTGNVSGGNLTTTGVLSVTGTGVSSIAGNLDMTSNTIINLANPTNDQDAATKYYVDSVAQGLHVHDSCYVATTGNLDAASGGTVSYNNGSSGVGATLTTTGTYNLIDGANVQTVGTRILVKNEANAVWNGVYTYTSTTVLTRATDFDTSAEMAGGDFLFVTSGSTLADTGWVQTTDNPTPGTSNIVFTQFSGAGTYTAGTGLTLTGTTFSVNASQTQVTALGTVTTGTWNSLVGSSATFAAGLSGANLASITGGNVTGQVANALVAGTVYTAAQPNITSVGTLTSLGVNGTLTAVNITANTGVFTGNGNGLSSLQGSNVTGQVANALVAGTVYTAAQPNITSVGTLSSLAVTGNTTSGNFIGVFANGNSNISIPAANGNINLSAAGGATELVITSTGVNVTGTLNATGNANVGNLGTTDLVVTGNANIGGGSGGNLSGANVITANTFIGNLQGNVTLGSLANGNSNVNIPAANGNVNISAVGNANILIITGTGVNVAGTLNATGNANVGNIGAANGVFTNVSGNGSSLSSITGGNVTGQVANALVAGTVYTAAQPNITSVGTLTSLGVNGTVTAVAFTANTGVFTGNGNGLSSLQGANLTGTIATGVLGNSTLYVGTTAIALNRSSGAQSLTGITSIDGYASTVSTAAQPNITSVGTLTSLGVSGAVTASTLTSNVATGTAPITVSSTTRVANLNVAYANVSDYSAISTVSSGNYYLQLASALTGNIADSANSVFVANTSNGAITATTFVGAHSGDGSALSALNASNITTGTLAQARLANSSLTVNGTSISLGGSGTITANGSQNLTFNNGGAGDASGTTYNGGTAKTISYNTIGAPSTTGTNASGTWGISVTGSAATVTTAAQPNITSVGTLTSLTVSGAVNVQSTTAATSTTTGALIVAGGIGTNANSYFSNFTVKSNIAYVSPNGANTINSTMLNGGTLAWSGNAGQLFSIADTMTGNIFSVNDVSGIPMITVSDTGTINLAPSGGFVAFGVSTGVTAAGSTQGTATLLTRPVTVVSTVTSGANGVVMPTTTAGMRVVIINTSANALNVYPASGGAINSGATNAAYSLAAGGRLEFISTTTTQWYTLNATYA